MTLSKARRCAHEPRQKDTGRGRAAAHLIPFYGLYYAISRRTITPFLYALVIHHLVSLVLYAISLIIITELLDWLSLEPTTEWAGEVAVSIALAAQTIGVKLGINQARK